MISVIVPVYGVEKYLHRCIESILCQTYSNFELILVDDGSPDNCPKICDEYARKDSRIKVIHKKNGGQSSARNAGLDICRGEYIYFCDSDDWIESNLLERALKKIKDEKADMVRFQCFTHFEDTSYQSAFLLDRDSVQFETDSERLDFMCNSFLNYQIGWELCLAMYKADILIQNKIRFPNGIDIAEDLYINLRDIVYASRITFLDEPLYHYCMRGDSTMGQVKGHIRLDEMNDLMSRFYKDLDSNCFQKFFYRIHNVVILNEVMGHLPELKNYKISLEYICELNKISNRKFFNEQLYLAEKNINYVTKDGIIVGMKKNAINNYLLKQNYIQYCFLILIRNVISFPVRVLNKLKRTLNWKV